MPITRAQGGAIPNLHAPSVGQRGSAQNVIAQLQYSDLWRGAGTLRDNGIMRVDMQGHIPGPPIQYNIQVQIDGMQGNSTVAHVNQSLDSGHSYTVAGTSP